MGSVSLLSVDEWVDIDGAFLGEVMNQLGPETAERLIEDALATLQAELNLIAGLIAALPASAANADHGNAPDGPRRADLVAATDRLSRMAWEIGLTTLSGVAVDLALCTERGDKTALHAVGARLQRVGQRSLGPAWDEAIFG